MSVRHGAAQFAATQPQGQVGVAVHGREDDLTIDRDVTDVEGRTGAHCAYDAKLPVSLPWPDGGMAAGNARRARRLAKRVQLIDNSLGLPGSIASRRLTSRNHD